MKDRNFSLFETILIGIGGFAVGGLITLITNTIQVSKIKNLAHGKYNCSIQAIIEPEKKVKTTKTNKTN